MAFTKPGSTDIVESTHPNQIMDALDGTAGQGQPIALTALSDATNPALQVRNQDSTNGKCQEWLDAAGAVMGRVIGTTTGYFEFLKKLTLTIGTVATGQNHLGITATWNASGETFKGIFLNVTNTASHANSRLIDLQVAGTSIFAVDTNGVVVPAVHVYHDANQSIANSTPTTLAFNTERIDTDTMHATGDNTKLTATTAGTYVIVANIDWEGNATGARIMRFLKNAGATVIAYGTDATDGTQPWGQVLVSPPVTLAAGDYVVLQVDQTSGGALNVLTAADYSPNFGMVRVRW